MSDHDWTFENLSAYLAGGLAANERQRVENHVAACTECAQALQESRELEQMMDSLFTNARPDADLEARALAKLRQARMRRASILRFVAAAAAVLVLGLAGAAVQAIAFAEMWMPGEGGIESQNAMKKIGGVPMADDTRSMSRGDRFKVVDVDPAAVDFDTDIQFSNERIENTSVPGSSNPNEALGMLEDRREVALKKQVEDVLKDTKALTQRGAAERELTDRLSSLDRRSAGINERWSREGWDTYGLSPDKNEVNGKNGLFLNLRRADDYAWDGATRKPGDGPSEKKPALSKPSPPVNTDGETLRGMKAGYFMPLKGKDSDKDKLTQAKQESDLKTPLLPALGVPAPPVNKPASVVAEAPKVPEPAADPGLKIIRTGEIEFEIDSFDAGVKKINDLIADVNKKVKNGPGAFRVKEDRTKQENGKTRGFVVVRIPPEFLDKFIEDLRTELGKIGDLKSQHVGSQDVTKQYTDTASELKAARLVEKRLIEIIETKKGEIKDLVAAEATLGTWRTKIEKMEGEIRYYNNQVALSTLTITLTEKDIGTPASLVVNEKVTMRVEVDDVKKALDGAVEAVRAFKGRILKSEIKQHKAGQFEAILHAEVPPPQKEAFGKKIVELGIVSENESTQKAQAEGGTGKPGNLAPRVNDVVFEVALNNIVNIQPRRSVTLDLATADVQASYKKLKDELAQVPKAQIRTDNLNEQDKLRITAHIDFNVPADKKEAVDEFLAKLGKVLKKTSVQAAITEIATDQKFGYTLNLFGPASIAPREVVTLKIEVKDVDKRVAELKEAVLAGKGRVADANVVRHENGQVTAQMVFDVPLAVQDLIVMKVKESGNLQGQQATRNPNVPENELATAQIVVTLSGVFAGKQPREKVGMNIEVSDVDQKASDLKDKVRAGKGRIADEKSSRQPNGQVSATLVCEVPLAEQEKLVKEFKDVGKVVSYATTRNANVPDNELATAQITLTLTAPNPIVDSDYAPGSVMRKGLSVSYYVFVVCVIIILGGLSFLLPVGVFLYCAFKAIRWMWPGEGGRETASAVKKPVNGSEKPA